MATRSSSNKNITKGMTYGKGKVLGEQIDKFGLPTIDARNNAIPPAATNTTDQTRNVEPMAEEVSVAMNESGQPVVPAMPMNNVLDLLKESDRPNEELTAGAFLPSLNSQEIGDLDFAVLADLADNSDVAALRQTFSF